MAIDLTERARLLAEQTAKEPQIILEIDGIDLVFGAIDVDRIPKFDEPDLFFDMPGLFFDGVIKNPKSRPYISLKGGTTTNITQQMNIDKGGTSSVTTMQLALIDKNGEMSLLFSPINGDQDLLARQASVYLGFKGGAHPEDSIKVFQGILDGVSFPAGLVLLSIAHPEQLKNQELFIKRETKLDGAINSSQATIALESTLGYLVPSGEILTYVQIDDEIIRYTGISGNNLTGCIRGQFSTAASGHDDGSTAESQHRIQGEVIDLMLKIMLSQAEEFYAKDVFIGGTTSSNQFLLSSLRFGDDYNPQIGDIITVSGMSVVSNNGTFTISNITSDDTFTYIEVSSGLTFESESDGIGQFKSKYNILPEGCGFLPGQVDIEQHLETQRLAGSTIPSFDIYLKDSITAKELLDEKMLFPAGLYLLPRKGRISCKATLPPLSGASSPIINSENILKPDGIKIGRSINKLFYNHIVFRYGVDIINGKYKTGVVVQSADSLSRIRTGIKPMIIEADGFKDSVDTSNKLTAIGKRLSNRYRFAAETIKVDVNLKTGSTIEIGDIVIFGDEALQITDTSSGTRDFQPRAMEITNKSQNIATGVITLELTNTIFGLNSRYGTISPSSSSTEYTTTTIKIQLADVNKWQNYIGSYLRVHSIDYSYSEVVRLTGFDQSDSQKMIITSLPGSPVGVLIVDVAPYRTVLKENQLIKTVHVHLCRFELVDTVTSNTVFDLFDVTGLAVGDTVAVGKIDYSEISNDTKITDITGMAVTIETDPGFTPEYLETRKFKDSGSVYRYF